MAPSIRPTVWVMNWVEAASWSCSSQLISTMLQPSRSKNCQGGQEARQKSAGEGAQAGRVPQP